MEISQTACQNSEEIQYVKMDLLLLLSEAFNKTLTYNVLQRTCIFIQIHTSSSSVVS